MSDAELIESLRGFFPDFFEGRGPDRDPAVVLDELTDWLELQLVDDDARATALDDVYRESRREQDRAGR